MRLVVGARGKLELGELDDPTPPCTVSTDPVPVKSVSVSQQNSFERCVRRWFFQKVNRAPIPENYVKKGASTGTEIHNLLDQYYKKGFVPKGHPHERKVLAALENLPKCGPGIESEISFKIQEANEVPFTGVIDLVDMRSVGQNLSGTKVSNVGTVHANGTGESVADDAGTVRIIDHKTTSAIAKREAEPVDMFNDPQVLTYAQVGYVNYGAERVEVAHNTISTTHVARVIPPAFEWIPRERAQENWERQRAVTRKMVAVAASPPADWNDVEHNPDACGDFGGCDFLALCTVRNPSLGVPKMSNVDDSAASDLLARLNALTAPVVAPAALVETSEIALDPTVNYDTSFDTTGNFDVTQVELLPPDAPSRMTPQEPEPEEKPKAKRGRKPKAAPSAAETIVTAPKHEYFAEKSITNVDEAVVYLNDMAEQGVRCVGIFDGLYFVFERPV